MEKMDIGTIVRNVSNDEIGVVAIDVMGCCSPEEEPVVYDGGDAFIGTDRSDLEVTGTYDPGVADAEKCGAGQGEKTCRYLTFGEGAFKCARFSDLRNTILKQISFGKVQDVKSPLPGIVYLTSDDGTLTLDFRLTAMSWIIWSVGVGAGGIGLQTLPPRWLAFTAPGLVEADKNALAFYSKIHQSTRPQ